MYDTQDPYNFTLKSSYDPGNISWTITDMDVDRNEQFLVYSTFEPDLFLVDLETLTNRNETLRVSASLRRTKEYFGFLSTKFSPCGKAVLAASNQGELILYDLESNKVKDIVLKAHNEDINTVCFADSFNPNLFYSGSDDCFIKLWD